MATPIPIAIKLVFLIAGSLGLAYVSRNSLLHVRSHGFYRFFAWEAILGLILLNLEYWIADPLSFHQVLSWICLLAATYLVVHGFIFLGQMGKQDDRRVGETLYAFEKTTSLVTKGAYRWIRHPLYSSLLFLAWGTYLKWITWPGFALVLIATLCLAATARVEEGENIKFFGPSYAEYRKHTKMFIPYIF
jgi:protein-S-isoprenylcysteine O-methyltransferase Ste14